MGYYTHYELEIRDEITFAKAKEILESLNKKNRLGVIYPRSRR